MQIVRAERFLIPVDEFIVLISESVLDRKYKMYNETAGLFPLSTNAFGTYFASSTQGGAGYREVIQRPAQLQEVLGGQ